MNKFTDLQEAQQIKYFEGLSLEYNLSSVAIEKDWWITAVLRALFALPYSEHLSFKGGTSLSKCYKLIERFSEDIDIAVYREFLSFVGTLSKTQINDKLRRAACSFVREKLQIDVAKELEKIGISADLFSVKVNITPMQKVALQSFVDKTYSDKSFADKPFEVNAVAPERTFLEKICLLHAEFTKPQEFMRTERMSRHLYDLAKLDEAGISKNALKNKELYNSIIEHRRIFVGLKSFDYDTLAPQTIRIVPPDNIIALWKTDYETMRETMIYDESLPFNKLIDKIKLLNERINRIE